MSLTDVSFLTLLGKNIVTFSYSGIFGLLFGAPLRVERATYSLEDSRHSLF